MDIIDYVLSFKDQELTEEICGSKLWIILQDLLKWSAAYDNKPKVKNIFNSKSKNDKKMTIEFRDKLNKYIKEWAVKYPLDGNGRKSAFIDAVEIFNNEKIGDDPVASNPLKKSKIVFQDIGTDFPEELPASSYFAIVLSVTLFYLIIQSVLTQLKDN